MNKTNKALKLSREIILHLLENHPTARHHRKTGEALSAIDAAIEEHETLLKQRDYLLATLEDIADDEIWSRVGAVEAARKAITKVTGESK